MGFHRDFRAEQRSQSDEAFSVKRAEVIAQVRARQERRGELRAQTGRLFVFLGVLVAFFSTLIREVDGVVDSVLLGVAMSLSGMPLALIYWARRDWRDVKPSRISISSAREADLSLIKQGEQVRKELGEDIRWSNAHLVNAELATAIVIFSLIGVALAVVPGDEAPRLTSPGAIASYVILAVVVLLLRFWLAPKVMSTRDRIQPPVLRRTFWRFLFTAPLPVAKVLRTLRRLKGGFFGLLRPLKL